VSVNRTRSLLYSIARFLGDYQAIRRRRVGRRLARRAAGRRTERAHRTTTVGSTLVAQIGTYALVALDAQIAGSVRDTSTGKSVVLCGPTDKEVIEADPNKLVQFSSERREVMTSPYASG
jgi:hypothetical protein